MTNFFFRSYAESLFFVLMIIGIIVALAVPSAVLSYLIIFVSGMMAGRIMYWRKDKMRFAYYLIILGFLIGFVIGTYYGSKQIVILLFLIGSVLSYYLYDKKIFRDTLF